MICRFPGPRPGFLSSLLPPSSTFQAVFQVGLLSPHMMSSSIFKKPLSPFPVSLCQPSMHPKANHVVFFWKPLSSALHGPSLGSSGHRDEGRVTVLAQSGTLQVRGTDIGRGKDMRAESQKPGAADGKHLMGWEMGTGDAPSPEGPGQSPRGAISSRRATPSQEWSTAAPGAPLGWELGAGGVSRT